MFWLGKHYKSYGLYSLKITPPPLSMLRVKSIHSGLWQNFLLLLAQMVVEQEADKLFS